MTSADSTPVEPLCQTCGCPRRVHDETSIYDVVTPVCYGQQAGYPCIDDIAHLFLASAEAPHEPLSVEEARAGIMRCVVCKGAGGFSDTTLGRGGFGGQQITPCPRCGGLGFDLTDFEAAVRREAEASLQARIEALERMLRVFVMTACAPGDVGSWRTDFVTAHGWSSAYLHEREHGATPEVAAAHADRRHPTDGGNR